MDPATLIAAVTGAFAGTAFPAAVAWRFIGIITKELRELREELCALRSALKGHVLTIAPEPKKNGDGVAA